MDIRKVSDVCEKVDVSRSVTHRLPKFRYADAREVVVRESIAWLKGELWGVEPHLPSSEVDDRFPSVMGHMTRGQLVKLFSRLGYERITDLMISRSKDAKKIFDQVVCLSDREWSDFVKDKTKRIEDLI